MRILCLVLAGAVAATASCTSPIRPTILDTGLAGTILRGPIQPVCVPEVSCDAPLVASFGVYSDTQQIATFTTDTQGHFEVRLPPGTYLILIMSDSTLVAPGSQPKQVTVLSEGVTTVALLYDTGIR